MSEGASTHALLRPRIVIPLVVITLIWGSTWLVIKDQLVSAPPVWSVTWRFALAAIGMFGFVLLRGERLRMARAGHISACLIGVSQFVLNYNFVYQAELHLTSGVVAVLYGLLIPANAVLGLIFLGEGMSRRFLVGSAIGLAGAALLLAHESRMAPMGGMIWLGLAFALAGIFCAASANVMQAMPTARRQSMPVLLAWAMLYGALADGAIAWIFAGPPVLPLEPSYLGGVFYLAIFGTVATFPAYYHLIRELGAGKAAYTNAAVPVVAMVLSTMFEDYLWSWLAAGGSVLALLGMVVALRARRPARKSG